MNNRWAQVCSASRMNSNRSIDALLQTVPDLERATRLANEALAPTSGRCADTLADWA